MFNHYVPDEEYVENNGLRPGIYFAKEGEEWRVNPLFSLDNARNTPKRFVILRTTGDGKFLKGGMLVYKYKGVEIFTDAKNAIFVDTAANRLWIRDYDKVLSEIDPVDPEERQYVFILYNEIEGEVYTEWESTVGRSQAYQFVRNNIDRMMPEKSIVLTDNVALKDALTIQQFVNHLKNNELVPVDDGFEIDDYVEEF